MRLRSQAEDGAGTEAPGVTISPAGIIDGDPAVFAALCARRGRAVLAYCRRVSAPGLSGQACAEAFAEFRRTIAQAADPETIDPDAALLRETRYAAAAHAPAFGASTPGPLDRFGRGQCATAPYVIAARQSAEMSSRACRRLASHIRRCVACREADARALLAEREYRDPTIEALPPEVAGAILSALHGALDGEAVAPVPAPVATSLDGLATPREERLAAPAASLNDDDSDADAAWLPAGAFDAPENTVTAAASAGPASSAQAEHAAAPPPLRSRRRRRTASLVLTSLAVAAGGVGLAMAMSSSSTPTAAPETSPSPFSSAGFDAGDGGQPSTIGDEPPAAAKPDRKAERSAARARSARARRAARARAARRARRSRATAPAPTRVNPPASPQTPRSVAPAPARVQPPPPPPPPPPSQSTGGSSPNPSGGTSPALPGGSFTDEGET